MDLRDYRPSERVTDYWYELCFDDGYNNGFAFPCDEHGNVLIDEKNEAARSNYEHCLANPQKFNRFNKVVRFSNTYTEPASGVCECGERVSLVNEYMGACECPNCGRWYNLFGQSLKPPREWCNGDDW